MFDRHSQPTGLKPRFALLRHELEATAGRFDHWDLMLEHHGSLLTLELTQLPSQPGNYTVRRLADHRLAYLDLEGHISGNRGHVIRLDRGRFDEIEPKDLAGEKHHFAYRLHGARLEAEVRFNQPAILMPFGQPLEMEVVQWHWAD
jgi:hypothetical protein